MVKARVKHFAHVGVAAALEQVKTEREVVNHVVSTEENALPGEGPHSAEHVARVHWYQEPAHGDGQRMLLLEADLANK